MQRVGALAQLAELGGIRVHEVADRIGVSRQTVHAQRDSIPDYHLPLDTRLLAALVGPHTRTDVDLIDELARGPVRRYEVEQAIEELAQRGDVRRAGVVMDGPRGRQILKVTAQGSGRLPLLVRQATAPPMRRWVVCVLSSRGEARTIEAEGSALLGADQVLVIDPCRYDMTEPEVAFVVEADDDLSACREAAARMTRLRQRVGGPSGAPVVRAIIQRPDPAPRPA
jgi:hypothetical protein